MEKRTNDMMSKIFGHFKPFKVTKIPLITEVKNYKKENNLSDIIKNKEEYHMLGMTNNYKIKEKGKTKQFIEYKTINVIKQPYSSNLNYHLLQNNEKN